MASVIIDAPRAGDTVPRSFVVYGHYIDCGAKDTPSITVSYCCTDDEIEICALSKNVIINTSRKIFSASFDNQPPCQVGLRGLIRATISCNGESNPISEVRFVDIADTPAVRIIAPAPGVNDVTKADFNVSGKYDPAVGPNVGLTIT
ncbi:MAG: hypothetical protein ACRCZF_00645, partial [Gemmataceae bacterium]